MALFRINAIIAYKDETSDSFTSLFDQTLQKYPAGNYATQEEELFSWPAFRNVWPGATFEDPVDISHIADITFFVASLSDEQEVVEAFGGTAYSGSHPLAEPGTEEPVENLDDFPALESYVEEFEESPLQPPGQATNLTPEDEASVPTEEGWGWELATVDFSIEAGAGATSHDVYLGTSSPPPLVGNWEMPKIEDSATLPIGTWYWRVDAKNDAGITEGVEWSFDVVDAKPPVP
jgi:hypothetical protein